MSCRSNVPNACSPETKKERATGEGGLQQLLKAGLHPARWCYASRRPGLLFALCQGSLYSFEKKRVN